MKTQYLPDIFSRQSLENGVTASEQPDSDSRFLSELLTRNSFISTIVLRDHTKLINLQEKTLEFAKERAQIKFSLNDSTSTLSILDHQFQKFLEENSQILHSNPSLIAQLYSLVRTVEEHELFTIAKPEFERLGYEAGLAQGRNRDLEKVADIETRKKQLLGKIAPLDLSHLDDPDKYSVGLVDSLCAAFDYHQRRGIKTQLASEACAVRIFRAIGGWRALIPFAFLKDIGGLQRTLENLGQRERGLVDQAYQAQHGVTLKKAFFNSFRRKHALRLRAFRQNDRPKMYAYKVLDELKGLLHTKKSRGKAVAVHYSELTAGEVKKMEQYLDGLLRQKYKESLQERYTRVLSSSCQRILETYREDQPHLAAALQLEQTLTSRLFWTRKAAREQLRDLSSRDLVGFAQHYFEATSRPLREDIVTHMCKGPAKELCLALLDQDETRIRAHQVACALSYRTDWIGSPFLNKDETERNNLIEDYCVHYGKTPEKFWLEVKRNCWSDDFGVARFCPPLCRFMEHLWTPTTNSYPFVKSIIETGELTKAQLLRYFMLGFGSDVDGIYTIFFDLEKSKIDQIITEYGERYRPGPLTNLAKKVPGLRHFILIGELPHDLKAELSGDGEFDIELMLAGRPTGPTESAACEALMERLGKRYTHEHSGWFLRKSRASIFRGDRRVLEVLESDFKNAQKFYEEKIEPYQVPAEQDVIRFRTLVRLAEQQCDAYRSTKVSLGDLFINMGAGLGATAGSLCAFLIAGASYTNVAILSGLGSLLWRQLVGKSVLGDGYGKDERFIQGIRAVIDGASIFWVRVGTFTLGRFFGAQLSSKIAKSGFKSGLHKFVKSLEENIKRQNKLQRFTEHPEEYHLYRGPEEVLAKYRQQLITGYSGTANDGVLAELFLNAFLSGRDNA